VISADNQTGDRINMTKLRSDFHDFGKAHKNHIKNRTLFSCSVDAFLKLSAMLNLKEPCVLYIGRAYRYPPNVAFYIFFSTNISTEYFKHVAHFPFYISKCRLFHNAIFFGSCIIQILHTGCAKI